MKSTNLYAVKVERTERTHFSSTVSPYTRTHTLSLYIFLYKLRYRKSVLSVLSSPFSLQLQGVSRGQILKNVSSTCPEVSSKCPLKGK